MRHSEITIKQIVRALDVLQGNAGVSSLMGELNPPIPDVLGDDTLGQVLALYKNLGREVVDAIRRGDVQVVIQDENTVKVIEAIRTLVDSKGVFIPSRQITGKTTEPNWKYHFDRTVANCTQLLERVANAFNRKAESLPTPKFLNDKINLAVAALGQSERFRYLINGKYASCMITVIPQIPRDKQYNLILSEIFVHALRRAFYKQFSADRLGAGDNLFDKGLDIIPDTGHLELLERAEKGFVVGLFFPGALQGWSVDAQRQLISTLPTDKFIFSLGGGIDTLSAWIANINILGKFYAPVQVMPAIASQSTSNVFYLVASEGLASEVRLKMLSAEFSDEALSNRSGGVFLAIKGTVNHFGW